MGLWLMDDLVRVCWCRSRRVEPTHADGARALSLLPRAAAGTAGHHARTAQALSLPRKHSTFAVFLTQFFSQRLYMRALTSFVTVVALNRK